MDTLVGVLIAACDTNNTLPEDHLKIVDELIYDGCVRESMNITELTQPFICYRFLKGSDKLTDCMLKWEWRASFVGVEVPLIRDRILNKYAACMKPIVPPEEEDMEE
ncbi:unnamed protein product [Oppiella nova]|uniref:Uncharacterized protein n=1 Tax=Oppiella nova TaxID=334625 RepID=A0A7R9MFY2_9ACAR|nr:unnamed protein product [Oppiella nova]CAG2176355.1 unnamed protein product [Oppiella nova]